MSGGRSATTRGRGRGPPTGRGRRDISANQRAQLTLPELIRSIETSEATLKPTSCINLYMQLCRLLPKSHEGASTAAESQEQAAVAILNAKLANNLASLHAGDLGTLMWCISKTQSLQPREEESFQPPFLAQAVVAELSTRLDGISGRDYVTGGGKNSRTTLNSKAVSNFLYGCAVMDPCVSIPHPLVQSLVVAVTAGSPQGTRGDWIPQGAANSLWSIGKLGLKSSDSAVNALLDALVSRLKALLEGFLAAPINSREASGSILMPQHLSNSLHGMATAGYFPSTELLETLSTCAASMLDNFSPQEVTNIVWSLASMVRGKAVNLNIESLPQQVRTLLHTIADKVPTQLQNSRWRAGMRPQTVSNLAWGYATLRMKPQRMFADLGREARHMLAQFKPQELANLQYAFALADYYPGTGLMDEMAACTADIAGRMRPEELSTSMWAWATLRYLPSSAITSKMVSCARSALDKFKSQEIGNVMWSLGRLAWMPGADFAEAVKQRLDSAVWDTCAVQDASNVLWGLCVLDNLDLKAMNTVCSKLAQRFLPEDFAAENCVQIFTAHQHLQLHGINTSTSADVEYQRVAVDVLRRGEQENSRQLQKSHVSITQSDVAATLRRAGIKCELEYPAAEDIAAVDVAILAETAEDERPVAVEVDGASHFTVNSPHAPLGKSVLRWKALEECGWKVVSVPFYSWNTLPTEDDRNDYMLRLLRCDSVWECLTCPLPSGQAFPPPRNLSHRSLTEAVTEAESLLAANAKEESARSSPATVVALDSSASTSTSATPIGPASVRSSALNVGAAPFMFQPTAPAPAPSEKQPQDPEVDLEASFNNLAISGSNAAAQLPQALLEYEQHLQSQRCHGPNCLICPETIAALWSSGIPPAQAEALRIYTSSAQQGALEGPQVWWPSNSLLVVALASNKEIEEGGDKLESSTSYDISPASTALSVLRLNDWLTQQRDNVGRSSATTVGSSCSAELEQCKRVEIAGPGGVLEALGTSLVAHKAPFKLHYRAGVPVALDCAAKLLIQWLFSREFWEWQAAIGCATDNTQRPLLDARAWKKSEEMRNKNAQKILDGSNPNSSIENYLCLFAACLGCEGPPSAEHPSLGGALQLLAGEEAAGRKLAAPPAVAALAAVYVGRRQRGLLPWRPAVLAARDDVTGLAGVVSQLMHNRNLIVTGDAILAAAIA